MIYNDITNYPTNRSSVTPTYAWWDGLFTKDELNKIQNYCDKNKERFNFTDGKVSANFENVISEHRKSNIMFIPPEYENEWIFKKFNDIIAFINNRYYGFDLNGYDSIQYSEYNSTNLGCYDMHMDMFLSSFSVDLQETRKLSFVLFLNEQGPDFEGGDFVINIGGEDEIVENIRGRIILFPSFVMHRVTPVTKGIRKSLVSWVVGPKFK